MRIEAIAFTKAGLELACRLRAALEAQGDGVRLSAPARHAQGSDVAPCTDLAAWTAEAWTRADALMFVSACGIAVRAVAPHVRDKMLDPAVVCVDEGGRFAIPVLSGHVGGANALAQRVAQACGATAVITTATDVRGVFAVDAWAREQDLAILERAVAKEVSARLLDGLPVGFATDVPVTGPMPQGLVSGKEATDCPVGISVSLDEAYNPFPRTLHLVPRAVSVGVGCRRDTPVVRIAALVDQCLREARVSPQAVRTLATIDVKADEECLCELARERGWALRTHSAKELAAVPGTFSSSSFVWQTVGVDNVCERAACACGERLLLGRRAAAGVTTALAVAPLQLAFPQNVREEQS